MHGYIDARTLHPGRRYKQTAHVTRDTSAASVCRKHSIKSLSCSAAPLQQARTRETMIRISSSQSYDVLQVLTQPMSVRREGAGYQSEPWGLTCSIRRVAQNGMGLRRYPLSGNSHHCPCQRAGVGTSGVDKVTGGAGCKRHRGPALARLCTPGTFKARARWV